MIPLIFINRILETIIDDDDDVEEIFEEIRLFFWKKIFLPVNPHGNYYYCVQIKVPPYYFDHMELLHDDCGFWPISD